jgi:hypothetical protein
MQDSPCNDGAAWGIVTVPPPPVETIELPLPDDDEVFTTLTVEDALKVEGETVNVAIATVPSAIPVEFRPYIMHTYWPGASAAQSADFPAADAVPATATEIAVKSEGEYEKVHSSAADDAPPELVSVRGRESDAPGGAVPFDRASISD